MNILVTGANGQLGMEMRNVSPGSADRYIFTDVAELDITDADAVDRVIASEKVDVIVNCAAYTNVDKAEEDEQTADLINHRAVAILASAAAKYGATLIHISTDYVFDGHSCIPYKEDNPTSPTGAYGRTKLAGERAVIESGCRYLIFRTAWLYSPYGKNFVKTMMKLTAEKDSLRGCWTIRGSITSRMRVFVRGMTLLLRSVTFAGIPAKFARAIVTSSLRKSKDRIIQF